MENEVVEQVTEEIIDAPEPEIEKPESAEDTVRKAFDALSEEEPKNEPEAEKEVQKEAEPKKEGELDPKKAREVLFKKKDGKIERIGRAENVQQKAPKADPIIPPQRLSVEQKEVFLKADPKLQKAYSDMVTEHEARATKYYQDYARGINEIKEITDAVRPYIPEWNLKNMSPGQAIRQICAAQKYLVDNKEDGWIRLFDSAGLDRNKLLAKLTGEEPAQQRQAQPVAAQLDPTLTQRLDTVSSYVEQQRARELAQAESAKNQVRDEIIRELEPLRNQRGADGKILYPNYHGESGLKAVVPLVTAIKEAQPNLPWGEVYKQAYHTLWGAPSSPSFAQSPRNSSAQQIQRAKAASVSLRGRGSVPQLAQTSVPHKMSDTVAMAYDLLAKDRVD